MEVWKQRKPYRGGCTISLKVKFDQGIIFLRYHSATVVDFIRNRANRSVRLITISRCPQIGTIAVQNMIMLGFGMSLAIPTVVIGSLMSTDGGSDGGGGNAMTLSVTEASWYGSVLLVCHPTGGMLSGVLQELIGRKWCMATVSLPQLVGWYVSTGRSPRCCVWTTYFESNLLLKKNYKYKNSNGYRCTCIFFLHIPRCQTIFFILSRVRLTPGYLTMKTKANSIISITFYFKL